MRERVLTSDGKMTLSLPYWTINPLAGWWTSKIWYEGFRTHKIWYEGFRTHKIWYEDVVTPEIRGGREDIMSHEALK